MKSFFSQSMAGVELIGTRRSLKWFILLLPFMVIVGLGGMFYDTFLWKIPYSQQIPYSRWLIIGHLEIIFAILCILSLLSTERIYIDLALRRIVLKRLFRKPLHFGFSEVVGIETRQIIKRLSKKLLTSWSLAIKLTLGRRIPIFRCGKEKKISRAAEELNYILEKPIIETRLENMLEQIPSPECLPSFNVSEKQLKEIEKQRSGFPARKNVKSDGSVVFPLKRIVGADILITSFALIFLPLSSLGVILSLPISWYFKFSYIKLIIWIAIGAFILYKILLKLLLNSKVKVTNESLKVTYFFQNIKFEVPLKDIKKILTEAHVYFENAEFLTIWAPQGIHRILVSEYDAKAVARELILYIWKNTKK